MAKASTKVEFIKAIEFRSIHMAIVGTSPLIMHRFSWKSWQELLLPKGRTNTAERNENLKHDPIEEYRQCFYRNRDPKSPTLFHIPNGAFHGAISSAALDIPGAKKTELERRMKIGLQVDLYGVPSLFMSMVRNSDMNRTPDVRTRPIFENWACKLTISYMVNPLNDVQVLNLAGGGGQIVGIGDWRPQKGGDYGCFRIADINDPEFKAIIAKQGRAPQQKAYDHPAEYDADTAELMAWFNEEIARRRQQPTKRASESNGHATTAKRGRPGRKHAEEISL